jgi:hypothetical protein
MVCSRVTLLYVEHENQPEDGRVILAHVSVYLKKWQSFHICTNGDL